MSQDEDADLQRQKALRCGNRAVVTKLKREVLVITCESVNAALLKKPWRISSDI